MFTLRRLQQFMAVAEELSFRRAAERLHMAQPPLSASIQTLESDIGTKLFVRRGRQIELTTAGECFLAEARAVISQVERSLMVARAAAKGATGVLQIAYTATTSYVFLPRVLERFRNKSPEVTLNLFEHPTWDQLDKLRAKRLDICLLRPPASWPAGVRHEVLLRERLVAVIPSSHRLARRSQVMLADLRSEPIIMFPPSWANTHHSEIVSACQHAGFTPNIVQEAAGLLAIVSFVASGMGVGFGPRSLMALHQESVVYREFGDATDRLYFDLAAAWNEDRQTPAALSFVEAARSVAAELSRPPVSRSIRRTYR